MSTAKFNISEMGTGNDTHSNFLLRNGYGNLLNRPGRQEITLDTASMYKKASEPGTMIGAGLGAMAGGIGGAELTEALGGSATAKLLGAVAGAGLGGVGGYYAGKQLDKADMDTGLSWMDRNLHGALSGAGSVLGALAGYGTSKYLVGSKNKTHHVLSALLGAGIGAGAGYLGAGGVERADAFEEGMAAATKYDLSPEKAREFAKVYAAKSIEGKKKSRLWMLDYDRDRTFWSNFLQDVEDDAEKYAYNHIHGLPQTTTNWWAAGGVGAAGAGLTTFAGAKGRKVRNLLHKKFQTNRHNYEQIVGALRAAKDHTARVDSLKALNDWYVTTRGHVSNRALKDLNRALYGALSTSGMSAANDIITKAPDLIKLLGKYKGYGRFRRFGRGIVSLLKAMF